MSEPRIRYVDFDNSNLPPLTDDKIAALAANAMYLASSRQTRRPWMEKIPTVYERDWDNDPSRVTNQVHEGCEWVLEGEGVATQKIDGTCVMYDGTVWWARRDVKEGKEEPSNFVAISHDPETGKTFGWEPIDQSGFYKWFNEAIEILETSNRILRVETQTGTYELVGPKINKNPEGYPDHELIAHTNTDRFLNVPRQYDALEAWLRDHPNIEGLVFHHPDGRMAKIKLRDFGIRRET